MYLLPEYLVWGEKGQEVLDEHFFVSEKDEWQEGGEVLAQWRKMSRND